MQNNVSRFPQLAKDKGNTFEKYAEYIDIFINKFQLLFKKTAVSTKEFSAPFNIDVVTVHKDFEMEVIDMQNTNDLKNVSFFSTHRKF